MSLSPQQFAELHNLLWELRSGEAAPERLALLERLVCEEPEARTLYVRYMHLCADLQWNNMGGMAYTSHSADAVFPPPPAVSFPTIVIHPVPAVQPTLFSLNSELGSMLFSYALSVLFVCFGMLIGWEWKLAETLQLVDATRTPMPKISATQATPPSSRMLLVGRITGLVDCIFSNDKYILPPPSGNAYVPLGRKYKLDSGLMEITYDSGAKVILQGPVSYEVVSADGGFLSFGKLTARVEKREEMSANRQSAVSSIQQSHSPLSLLPSPLFSVRTPNATVTDLGTEFGVEFDSSGVTKSHVFQGRVELRVDDDGKGGGQSIDLVENESAIVKYSQDRVMKVIRQRSREKAPIAAFTRRMPKRVPIELFNTGVGLNPGQADPHWQIVAADNDPAFKPRSAVVPKVLPGDWLENDPAQSQWISDGSDPISSANCVAYTFRTTFKLQGALTQTAVIKCRYIADNRMKAIRLNGKDVLPKGAGENPFEQFNQFFEFSVRQDFVEGINSLEIDVWNGAPYETSDSTGPMGLRVELSGSTLSDEKDQPSNRVSSGKKKGGSAK